VFKLKEAQAYSYLNQSDVFQIQGRSDGEELKETKAAMETMGFSSNEQQSVFRIVSAILHLGNIAFESDKKDASVVTDQTVEELEIASDLLQVTSSSLRSGSPLSPFPFSSIPPTISSPLSPIQL